MDAEDGKVFGAALPKGPSGIQALLDKGEDPILPGVCVFSRRAAPLAGWTNGLELARVVADKDRACLILETGGVERWKYGQFPRTAVAREEADAWNMAKKGVNGLHFLAVQSDPEADEIAGIWVLQDRELPTI